jgi:ADP-dependent phosphofructokinase/glucokinase
MQQMGVAYRKNVNKNVKISESDVSKSSIAKMDIGLILSHIENYEKAIADGDLNLITIKTLSTLYQ